MATSCYKTDSSRKTKRQVDVRRDSCRASGSAILAGEVLSGCPDESTGGDDVRKGGEIDWGMTEDDEKEETETDRRQKDVTNSNKGMSGGTESCCWTMFW